MSKNQKQTGVSIAINEMMNSDFINNPIINKTQKQEFTVKIANTLEEREAAFNLCYKSYLKKGYIKENPFEWLVREYDANSETVILIVQDREKNIAGSATLVFDRATCLPAEKMYKNELNELKKINRKTAELARLTISPNFRNLKNILTLLFNYAAIYVHHVKRYDGMVIEVTPGHKNYYKELLSFDEIGPEKPYPQQGTPVVLLHLSTKKYLAEINRFKNNQFKDKKERSLFSLFLKPEQESLVAFYLERQAIPITAEEKMYFGFIDSDVQSQNSIKI